MKQSSRRHEHAICLNDAIQMCTDCAQAKHNRSAKAIADLMGVELKTYYNWLAESSMPTNRIRQFELFCGCSYLSEYLCVAAGKAVINISAGKNTSIAEISELHANADNAITLLSRFYEGKSSSEETLTALNKTLTDIACHRQNVVKHAGSDR